MSNNNYYKTHCKKNLLWENWNLNTKILLKNLYRYSFKKFHYTKLKFKKTEEGLFNILKLIFIIKF